MYPCLWLRGLLPQQLVPCASAPVATFPTFVSGPQCPSGSWPAGYYGTDASGGVFSSIPQLRRVGVGIASLFVSHSHGTEEVEYAFGAWSALVKSKQFRGVNCMLWSFLSEMLSTVPGCTSFLIAKLTSICIIKVKVSVWLPLTEISLRNCLALSLLNIFSLCLSLSPRFSTINPTSTWFRHVGRVLWL